MFKSTIRFVVAGGLLLALASQLPAAEPQPAPKLQENEIIAILKSNAGREEKAEALRQLAVVGTNKSLPAVVDLLGNEELSHMARYAIEPNPDPAVDEALRQALGKLTGKPLVGVIGSIGVRRDAKATDALAKLLQNADPDVVRTAACSLGRIATPEAVKALQDALAAAPAANRLSLCEGLFRCAKSAAANGKSAEAIAIYDRLRGLAGPHQARTGGVRGAIVTRGKDGLPLMKEMLQSKDYLLFAAAVRAACEMRGDEVAQVLIGALAQLPADRQIVVMQMLGNRADAAASPALAGLAKSGATPVRVAAIRAMAQIGQASAGPVLMGLMDDSDKDVAKAAQEGFAGLPGKEVDDAVIAMFNGTDATRRLAGLELIGRRRMTAAIPGLFKATADSDAKIRSAAMRRLGELGGAADLPALLDLLMGAKSPQDLGAAEQAVSAVCMKLDKPETAVAKLTALLAQAQPAQKVALLRVLGMVGGDEALKVVRAAVKDANKEVHVAAIRSLASWKTTDAIADLFDLAQNASVATDKMLGLRGYLGWAGNKDVPTGERLNMCRKAAGMIQTTEGKKLLLSALGNITSPDSLAMIVPFLDDPATKGEAAAAVVAVSEKILKGPDANRAAPKIVEALQKVVDGATGFDLAKRANTALQQAKGKIRRK